MRSSLLGCPGGDPPGLEVPESVRERREGPWTERKKARLRERSSARWLACVSMFWGERWNSKRASTYTRLRNRCISCGCLYTGPGSEVCNHSLVITQALLPMARPSVTPYCSSNQNREQLLHGNRKDTCTGVPRHLKPLACKPRPTASPP